MRKMRSNATVSDLSFVQNTLSTFRNRVEDRGKHRRDFLEGRDCLRHEESSSRDANTYGGCPGIRDDSCLSD